MIGTVNELGQSQQGNPKVKIDGNWYSAGRCDINGIKVGQKIEFEYNEFGQPRNGRRARGLENWRPVLNGSGAPAHGNPVSDDAEMRFISNVVGSAIAAGTLKEPVEVTKWAIAAKGALKALKGGADPDFNDEIPNYGSPPPSEQGDPGW